MNRETGHQSTLKGIFVPPASLTVSSGAAEGENVANCCQRTINPEGPIFWGKARGGRRWDELGWKVGAVREGFRVLKRTPHGEVVASPRGLTFREQDLPWAHLIIFVQRGENKGSTGLVPGLVSVC